MTEKNIEARAREIAAGLSEAQRRDLLDTCARGSYWRSRTAHLLEDKGLVWGSGNGRSRAYRPTELGRAVAALLSKEGRP